MAALPVSLDGQDEARAEPLKLSHRRFFTPLKLACELLKNTCPRRDTWDLPSVVCLRQLFLKGFYENLDS